MKYVTARHCSYFFLLTILCCTDSKLLLNVQLQQHIRCGWVCMFTEAFVGFWEMLQTVDVRLKTEILMSLSFKCSALISVWFEPHLNFLSFLSVALLFTVFMNLFICLARSIKTCVHEIKREVPVLTERRALFYEVLLFLCILPYSMNW